MSPQITQMDADFEKQNEQDSFFICENLRNLRNLRIKRFGAND